MKKILINYADEKYLKTQKFNSWTGKFIAGFDKVYSFTPNDIESRFYCENKKILNISRGNGLWLWKPYFINKVLSECNEGDYIFYCDSGSFFIKKIHKIINEMDVNENIWVSDIPLIEKNFTKPSCIRAMNCNIEEYLFSNQIQATFIMIKNCAESRSFVREWLTLCCDFNLISPQGELSGKSNSKESFLVHREDQSILSLLCKKKGILAHKDPSQRGYLQESYYNPHYVFKKTKHSDIYGTVIFLHKSPSVNIVKCIKIMINGYRNKLNYYIKKFQEVK